MSTHHYGIVIPLGILIVLGTLWAFNHRNAGDVQIPQGQPNTLVLVAEAIEPSGEVSVIRNGSESTVTHKMTLIEGDVIRTKQGNVSLEFFAGSRVALDQGTEITITRASINADNPRIQHVDIALHAGRIWNRVLKLLEVDAAYRIQGAALAATVRGTAFAMTSHPGVAGSDEALDLFDGHLEVTLTESDMQGILEPGFTIIQGIGNNDASFAAHVVPTPDDVRNDPFIRAQLNNDKAFLERVQPIRQQIGDNESYAGIGEEAGPFTLGASGDGHSSYQYLDVRAAQTRTDALQPGTSVNLSATAHFYQDGTMTQEDVSQKATWQLSDTSIATLSRTGVLTAKEGNGVVIVIARWNDGTHEHSGSMTIPIGRLPTEIAP